MRPIPHICVLAQPTEQQLQHLSKQLKHTRKIIDTAMALDKPVNPFGQPVDSFPLQTKTPDMQLWAAVNSAMQGFSVKSLANPMWRNQFNMRTSHTHAGFAISPEPDNAIFIPILEAYTGNGLLQLSHFQHVSTLLPHNARVNVLGMVFEPEPATATQPASISLKVKLYYTTKPYNPTGRRRTVR